jgi:hypothetical protein
VDVEEGMVANAHLRIEMVLPLGAITQSSLSPQWTNWFGFVVLIHWRILC